jgi:hypothetical protein
MLGAMPSRTAAEAAITLEGRTVAAMPDTTPALITDPKPLRGVRNA